MDERRLLLGCGLYLLKSLSTSDGAHGAISWLTAHIGKIGFHALEEGDDGLLKGMGLTSG